MVTTAQLHEKYGEDIVFLFKGAEPYTEALGNPLGVLIERDDKVLCYECETWHEKLSGPPQMSHIKLVHNMTADQYKEKWGFNYSAPLCSRKVSQQLSRGSKAAYKANPEIRRKLASGRKKAYATRKANGFRTRGKKSMQHSNSRASCPEQIKQRYRLLQAKYGRDVSVNIIRVTDPYVESWAVKHYGTWNAFKEQLGEPTKEGGPAYQRLKADLIYDLRLYVEKHNKLPWDTYTKRRLNGFPHSITPYETHWGTLGKAYLVCGINSEYFTNDEDKAEKYWYCDPEWAETATKSHKRVIDKYGVKNPLKEIIEREILENQVDQEIHGMVKHGLVTPQYQNFLAKPKIKSITLTNKGKVALGRT